MKLYYGFYTLNDSCGSSHVLTDAQTKMKSDLCMLLHHALYWAVYETSQFHEIMVPLAHATSEGSDEPAHPHSLARGINAHIQGMYMKVHV